MKSRGATPNIELSAELVAKIVFLLLAVPALLRAALRVQFHRRRVDCRRLPARLRQTAVFRWPLLRRPQRLALCVGILVRCVPSWRSRACVESSLLLLDLWSRCGLEPRLHYGVRLSPSSRIAHAWVSSGEPASIAADASLGCETVWSA